MIRLRENGGGHVITGDGTSLLGADDKAGVAAIMELACRLEERSIPHPRLVFLFTTDEEIGEFGGDLPAELLERICTEFRLVTSSILLLLPTKFTT